MWSRDLSPQGRKRRLWFRQCARCSPAARIVNVSSGAGSLTRNSNPAFPRRSIFGPVYPASKTALNAMTLAMPIALESTGIKVNAACPGFTKEPQQLCGRPDCRGGETNVFGVVAVTQAMLPLLREAREPVRLALIGPDGPTGTFSNASGVLPW